MWDFITIVSALVALAVSIATLRRLQLGHNTARWRWLPLGITLACPVAIAHTIIAYPGWLTWIIVPTFTAVGFVQFRIFRGKPTMQERWDDQIEANLSAPDFGEWRQTRALGARMKHCPNNPANGGDGFDVGDGTWRDRRTHR